MRPAVLNSFDNNGNFFIPNTLGSTSSLSYAFDIARTFFSSLIKPRDIYMSHFAYACKTEQQNGISCLISELLRTLDSSLRDRLFVLQNEVF